MLSIIIPVLNWWELRLFVGFLVFFKYAVYAEEPLV